MQKVSPQVAAKVQELLRRLSDDVPPEHADSSDISKDITFDVWDVTESAELLTTQCVREMK